MKKILTLVSVIFLVFLAGCGTTNSNISGNNNTNTNSANTNDTSEPNNEQDEEVKPNEPNEGTASNEDKADLPELKEYYPVKENTRYVYEGNGNEFASSTVYTDYISGGKFQQRVDNGGTVMANVYELKDGKLTKVFSRGEAYYRENLLEKNNEDVEVLLMEPLQKGTTWTLVDSKVRTITNTDVNISTPAGEFQTIEVTTEGTDEKIIDYYAKGVGLVKSVFIAGDQEVTSTLSKIEEKVALEQDIRFYYPNIDDGKLYYQNKKITFNTNDITKSMLESAYKEAVNETLGKVFSANTKINSLYLNNDNAVYIDLSADFVKEMNAGSGYEEMLLQSLANTFGDYYHTNKVYVTIDQNPYESGHFSMGKGDFLTVDTTNSVEVK
jgi:hypothetical protein